MKKIVPDPPSLDLSSTTTANTPFGTHRMFTVRAGIPAEEALIQACELLQSAEATVRDAVDHLTLNDRALVSGAGQHIEAARALVDAVLDGAVVPRIFTPYS